MLLLGMQQHKITAFASGMLARLDATSGVSGLDEQVHTHTHTHTHNGVTVLPLLPVLLA